MTAGNSPGTRRRLPLVDAPERSTRPPVEDLPDPPPPVEHRGDVRRRLRRARRFVRSLVGQIAWKHAPYVTSVTTVLGARRREALRLLTQRVVDGAPSGTTWTAEAPSLAPATLHFRDPAGRRLAIELARARRDVPLKIHGGLAVSYRFDGPVRGEDRAWVLAAVESLDVAAREHDEAGWVGMLTAPDAVEIAVYPRDRRVELRPTLACNHHCAFCNSVDHNVENALHGAADLRASVDDWSRLPVFRAIVSGGEPTLLKDLPAIVAGLAADGLLVELQTNGMALADPGYTARLRDAGLHTALVSLHASHAALGDAITRFPGGWARTVQGIDHALAHGLAVELSHVIHRANAADTTAFLRFVDGRWGRRVRVRLAFVAPTGAASEGVAEVVPPLAEVLPEVRSALAFALARRLRLVLVGYCGIPPCLLAPFEHLSESVYRGGINAPEDHVKFAACRACVYDVGCPGLWKEYVDAHGDPGVRTVTVAPLRVRAVSWLTRRVT